MFFCGSGRERGPCHDGNFGGGIEEKIGTSNSDYVIMWLCG